MVNPFYIDPTGGRDTAAAIGGAGHALAGLGGVMRQREQEQQLQQRQAAGRQAVKDAMGDPAKMAQVMIDYPELQKVAESAFGFTSEQTKPIVNRTISNALANPEMAEQYLTQGVQEVQQAGGNPQNMMDALAAIQADPEAGFKQLELGAATLTPNVYQAYIERKKQEAGAVVKPTANIQDFDRWASMPEGPEKTAFGKAIGIEPKETAASAESKIKRVEAKKVDIRNASATLDQIEAFLSNKDYVDKVTGYTGRIPAISTAATDAEAAFESMVDNLTLANLDKMSGVLTDRDIQLLANAASGLRYGMSEKALKENLSRIKDKLSAKIKAASEGVPVSSLTTEEETKRRPAEAVTTKSDFSSLWGD